jgi:magnesium transporter
MAAAGLNNEADIFAPVIKTTRNRSVWLGVNLITALLGSWVIGLFEGSIQELVALAVLMPIVASMGGNAGTQTLTVVIRGMSIGTISDQNVRNVLIKESLVGVLNGLLWAVVIAVIAALWFQNVHLGIVIACAMVVNLIMGAIAGVLIPVFLEKMGVDPALAGGVALTTVTDVVGYFSVLGLATIWLL